MKFRQHRGSLDDSMKTVVELEPTEDALRTHLTPLYANGGVLTDIKVKPCCYDERIDWDSWLVTVSVDHGTSFVVGYTDGGLEVKGASE